MANFVSPNQIQIQIGLVLLVGPHTRDDTSQPCEQVIFQFKCLAEIPTETELITTHHTADRDKQARCLGSFPEKDVVPHWLLVSVCTRRGKRGAGE